MKNIFSILLAVMASVFVCNAAFAKNTDNLNTTMMTPVAAGASSIACDLYPYPTWGTCVSVTNLSSYLIFIDSPLLPVRMTQLNPGYSQPIVSRNSYSSVQVTLYDYAGRMFFNQYVNNRWDVPVYDRAGKLTAQAQPK